MFRLTKNIFYAHVFNSLLFNVGKCETRHEKKTNSLQAVGIIFSELFTYINCNNKK